MPPVSQFDSAVIMSDARARQHTNSHNYCTIRSRDAASSAGISKNGTDILRAAWFGVSGWEKLQPTQDVCKKIDMPLEMPASAKEATRDTIF